MVSCGNKCLVFSMYQNTVSRCHWGAAGVPQIRKNSVLKSQLELNSVTDSTADSSALIGCISGIAAVLLFVLILLLLLRMRQVYFIWLVSSFSLTPTAAIY